MHNHPSPTLSGQVTELKSSDCISRSLLDGKEVLERFFSEEGGFGKIERINYLDGIRISFSGGDIAHMGLQRTLRNSGFTRMPIPSREHPR